MSMITVGLVGNPNCGKSTLFNALTGAKQKVGNWPGVTVECKTGHFLHQQRRIDIVDLPGIYQLSCASEDQAIDEKIACEFILNHKADVIVNILDATHLERHLYLTLQLLSIQIPLILAVNMMDVANKRQMELKLARLAQLLGCPVIGLVANKKQGLVELKKHITSHCHHPVGARDLLQYPPYLTQAIATLTREIKSQHAQFEFCAQWLAENLLQRHPHPPINASLVELAASLTETAEQTLKEELDIVFADIYYQAAHRISQEAVVEKIKRKTITQRLDQIILHRILGIPIFLVIMYCMFLFAINLGGAFQEFFDVASNAIFVQGTTLLLNYLHASAWLTALFAAGLGRGINTILSFTPVIGAMFFFLAFLEGCGYMARASVVIDRLMRTIGLPGKSFVPMIIGFGCNVPAILAARTLENARDRTLTILMSPFMSCGARLAIFAVFTAAFFPVGGQNVVFSLYLIGISAAILTGLTLQKTLLQGEATPLILELPNYHWPTLSGLFIQAWQRLKSFIFRAGKLIIPTCMLIGVLNVINPDGSLTAHPSPTSLLSTLGRTTTPLFAPIGISKENWPATVSLMTGILAKEVVVATLNTLYMQQTFPASHQSCDLPLTQNLKNALWSIPVNLQALKKSFAHPLASKVTEHSFSHRIYGIMYAKFGGQAAAFSYLLFVLLYFPCISATAVMAKELNKKWALFSVVWSTGIAYGVATSFYQLATFCLHPRQSLIELICVITTLGCALTIMKAQSATKSTSLYANRAKTIH